MKVTDFDISKHKNSSLGIVLGVLLDAISIVIDNLYASVGLALVGTAVSLVFLFLIIIREYHELKKEILKQKEDSKKQKEELKQYFDELIRNSLQPHHFIPIDATESLEQIMRLLPDIRRIFNLRLRHQEKSSTELWAMTNIFRGAIKDRFLDDKIFCLHEVILNNREYINEAMEQLENLENYRNKCLGIKGCYHKYYPYIYPHKTALGLHNYIIIDYFEGGDEKQVIFFNFGNDSTSESDKHFICYMSTDIDFINQYKKRFLDLTRNDEIQLLDKENYHLFLNFLESPTEANS